MAKDGGEVRRRIAFDEGTYLALDRLAKDRMVTLRELADEAFRDLLKKAPPADDLEGDAARERASAAGQRP
jgi:hypothetical protein